MIIIGVPNTAGIVGITCRTVRSGVTVMVRSALMPTLMISRASMDLCSPPQRRPGESRDPYRVMPHGRREADAFQNNQRWWLWVPAFAGTTNGGNALLI